MFDGHSGITRFFGDAGTFGRELFTTSGTLKLANRILRRLQVLIFHAHLHIQISIYVSIKRPLRMKGGKRTNLRSYNLISVSAKLTANRIHCYTLNYPFYFCFYSRKRKYQLPLFTVLASYTTRVYVTTQKQFLFPPGAA